MENKEIRENLRRIKLEMIEIHESGNTEIGTENHKRYWKLRHQQRSLEKILDWNLMELRFQKRDKRRKKYKKFTAFSKRKDRALYQTIHQQIFDP